MSHEYPVIDVSDHLTNGDHVHDLVERTRGRAFLIAHRSPRNHTYMELTFGPKCVALLYWDR